MSKRLLVEQKHTKAGIEFIKEGLEEFGIEKKQTIKTMLLVEEVLVKLREHAKDPDENICIILNKRFGRVYVNLSLRGEKFQFIYGHTIEEVLDQENDDLQSAQEKEEKIFPGYVLVEMIMDEDSWYVVRHTAGVTKFVGSAKKPIPAKDSEIKKIIHRSTTQTQKIEMDAKVGEKVRIISGPFAEFVGDITEVYPDKAKLRAMVSIFGRETPVELEYKQIQKL